MTPLLFVLSFAAAFFLALFAILVIEDVGGGSGRSRRRLRRLEARPEARENAAEDSVLRKTSGSPGALASLSLWLERAGEPLTPGSFLGSCAACAALGALTGASFAGPAGALAGASAGVLPGLVVEARRRARSQRFERMFPESLDLLSRALRAGHALSASLHMLGEELDDPIGPEFARVSEEIRLGLDVNVALADLARRTDVPEMPFFVTALLIQRETGGNLAEIIDGLARVIRDRHIMNGKIRAVTAQTRWSAHVLLIAPFAFAGAMSLLRPDYVAPLWETPLGNFLAGSAFVMVIVGYALCRRLGVVKV